MWRFQISVLKSKLKRHVGTNTFYDVVESVLRMHRQTTDQLTILFYILYCKSATIKFLPLQFLSIITIL